MSLRTKFIHGGQLHLCARLVHKIVLKKINYCEFAKLIPNVYFRVPIHLWNSSKVRKVNSVRKLNYEIYFLTLVTVIRSVLELLHVRSIYLSCCPGLNLVQLNYRHTSKPALLAYLVNYKQLG